MNFVAQHITRSANHQLALKLAAGGLPTFPCWETTCGERGVKSPRTPHGFKDATTDVDQINRWWHQWPDALPGLPTGSASGVSVIDLDIDNNTGETTGLTEAKELGLDQLGAVKVATPSGGLHLMFAHAEGARVSTQKAGTHIDVRGEGGYVIAPGTVMPDGSSYTYQGISLSQAMLAGALPPFPVETVQAAIAARKEAEQAKRNAANAQANPPASGFAIATNAFSDTEATAEETLEATQSALAQAPNTFSREDWVKLAGSLKAGFGETLQAEFVAFSLRYSGGTPCTEREALHVWSSTTPHTITSIAPALALLRDAMGERDWKVLWRDVLGRRDPNNPSSVPRTEPPRTDDWPEPDLTLTGMGSQPAPVMNDAELAVVFGNWAKWLKTAAETKNAPIDFVALSLVSVASAIIGNTRWTVAWDGWKEPPIIWAMLVGMPSSNKSPALDAIMDPIAEIDQELSQQYQGELDAWNAKDEMAALIKAEWKAEAKKAISEGAAPPDKPADADAGERPIRGRVRISDTTTEKAAELLRDGWRGLLLFRDELSGWLGGMDRYNGGGDRPFWLESYGGRPYSVDRKANPEPVIIDHLSIAILGGTQPDKLDSLLVKTEDDGLLPRFCVVAPDPPPLKRPGVFMDAERIKQGMFRLRDLKPAQMENGEKRPFFLQLTAGAQDALQEFRVKCREWETDAQGHMRSHIGKMPGMVIRFATVLAHLDYAWDGQDHVTEITAVHIGRAAHYVGEHLRLHAQKAYGSARLSPELIGAKSIADVILRERPKQLSVRDIQKRGRTGLTKSAEVKAALDVLEDAGWLAQVRQPTSGAPKVFYSLNPRLEALS